MESMELSNSGSGSSMEPSTIQSTLSMEIDASNPENTPSSSATPSNGPQTPLTGDADSPIVETLTTVQSIGTPAMQSPEGDASIQPPSPLPLSSPEKRKRTNNSSGQKSAKRSKHSKPDIMGVVVGTWRQSDQQDDDDKHIVHSFIDVDGRFRGKVYPMNRRGEERVTNIPRGPGGCWLTLTPDRIIFDTHLTSMNREELKEYTLLRTPPPGPRPVESAEECARLDAQAASQAVLNAAGRTPKKPGPSTPMLPLSVLAVSAQHQSGAAGSSALDQPTNGVLIGVWTQSTPETDEDKNAVYGTVTTANQIRVKFARHTRDGRPVYGNYRGGNGGVWLVFDEDVTLNDNLKHLSRDEVKEFVRIQQALEGEEREKNFATAIEEAQRIVAEAASVPAKPRTQTRRGSQPSRAQPSRASPPGRSSPPSRASRSRRTVLTDDEQLARREKAAPRIKQLALAELKDNMADLNHIWANRPGAQSQSAPAPTEVLHDNDGKKFERKLTGLFPGKLVATGEIIIIDGEEYAKHEVLTKLA